MSVMQTTCPSCHAVFRVRPEQLEAHAGKVRCGKCAYVFNGFETLITPIETVSFMAPYEEDVEESARETAVGRLPDEARATPLNGESVAVYDVRPMTISEPMSGSFPLQTDEQLAREAEEINRVIAANSHPDLVREKSETSEKPEAAAENAGLKISPELHAKLTNLQQQLSEQEKGRRWYFLGWGGGIMLLLLALAAQSIYFYRDSVAVYYPQAKPLLVEACQLLGCQVRLPANINLIKLDGHELQAMPDRPNVVTFSALLRNNAAHRQAYPNLELTLTDLTNQALARRHFTPKEYLPPGTKIENGMPMQEEVPLKLTLDLDRLEAVGYKSRVYYP